MTHGDAPYHGVEPQPHERPLQTDTGKSPSFGSIFLLMPPSALFRRVWQRVSTLLSNTASMFAGELVMVLPPGTLLGLLTLNSKRAARRRTAVSARG